MQPPGASSSPTESRAVPDIRIDDRRDVAALAGGATLLVRRLHVQGQTRFSEQQLLSAIRFAPNQTLTLADLRQFAAQISHFYNAHGYLVAQAYVPAQAFNDGVITVTVIEGRFDAVDLHNRSRVRDAVARGLLADVKRGAVIEAGPLERDLLLLSDLPGTRVRSTLSPGADVGASTLGVDLTPGPRISGALEVDNAGSRYTGAVEGGGTINLNEPLGIGDVASVRVLTSGDGLQYVRGSYQATVGQATIGAAYAFFHYRLGEQFSALDANGEEQIASLYASYPLIRSYDNNLQLLVDADHRVLHDRIGLVGSSTARDADVVTVGVNGDHRDRVFGGGWDAYSIYVSGGDLTLETPSARAADALTARTAGNYGKVRFSIDRLQTIAGPFEIYGLLRGQIASTNLDITEKMELGGAYGVRAYPEGEAYGDSGLLATLEGRYRLPRFAPTLPGTFQLIGFIDTGWVRFADQPWTPGRNTATRTGAGVGLTWAAYSNFVVRTSYAFRLGPAATSAPDHGGQFRFEIVKFF